MVQVIQRRQERPSFSEEFGRTLGTSLGQGATAFVEGIAGKKMKEKEDKDLEVMSKRVSGLTGIPHGNLKGLPKDVLKDVLRSQMEGQKQKDIEGLRGENKQNELLTRMNPELEDKYYETMKEMIGPNFAKVWKASPIGARTKLEETAVDLMARGENIEGMFHGIFEPEKPMDMKEEMVEGQGKPLEMKEKKGKIIEEDFKKRPYGYNPKEWIQERKTWRKDNTPIFEENKRKLNNIKGDQLSTRKLEKLNESMELPEGLSRLLINPETGDFYGVSQVLGLKSPEAQEWSKVIARFQNRAKDAFGSRITNFDLQSYMRQFPDLLNTKEGRSRIIEMMKINYDLDRLYADQIEKIYHKHGLDGIPQEKADEIARSRIEKQTKQLEDKFLSLDQENIGEDDPDMLDVIGPNGEEYKMNKSYLDQLPEGYRVQ